MKQNDHGYTPIKLVDTQNSIQRNAFVICIITRAFFHLRNGMDSLVVQFMVTSKGQYKDFMLKTEFGQTYKNRRRLSFLCNSIGIYDELQSPDQLVGRQVKIRLVLSRRNYKGKKYTGYRIAGFFPVNRGADRRENGEWLRYMQPDKTQISDI
jgi:hypothetical protein